jgi:hypothetical protein
MDVPEDHPVGVDAEAMDDAGERRHARAVHLRAEHRRHDRRDAASQQATRDARHRGGAQQFGQIVEPGRERAGQPPGEDRLEPGERRAGLVVLRRRAVARQAAEQPACGSEGGLRKEMAIEVVAVRGPDPLGQPDARVVDAHRGRLEPGGHPREPRGRAGGDPRVDGEAPAGVRQPRPHERGIVVARHHDHLPPAPELCADRPQNRLGDLRHPLRVTLEQLDDVAEQDQPVDALERLEEGGERAGAAKHVPPEPSAEMQIGEHDRAHADRTMAHGPGTHPVGRRRA